MLGEVEAAWKRPVARGASPIRDRVSLSAGLREQLEAVTLPRVHFDGVPLSQALEALSRSSEDPGGIPGGLNIVLLSPDGRDPRLHLTLRHLSFLRILDFITESVGYEYDIQADAVVVRRGSGDGTRLETEFFPLSRSTMIRLTGFGKSIRPSMSEDPFAPPSGSEPDPGEEWALRQFLQRAGIPFDSVPGANLALADGQLIVTQTPRNLDKVRNLLRRYSEVKQVEIETRFLEVQEGDLEELGLNWILQGRRGPHAAAARTQNRALADPFTVSPGGNRIEISRPPAIDPEGRPLGSGSLSIPQGAPVLPNHIDLAAGAVHPSAALSGVFGSLDVDLIVRALARRQGNDLLSAPKITVLSGKTAQIVVAQEMRYPQSFSDISAQVGRGDSNAGSAGVAITAGTPQNFAVRNVGVEMEVTPTVEDDNAISLVLEPRVTEFEGYVEHGGTSVAIAAGTTVTVPSGFYQPVFSVRRIRTEVTIWDGATVVMGGLTREHAVKVEDRVPVLSQIPVLGRLFRSKGESTQKRNLLIFVTANLISPGGSLARQQVGPIEPGGIYQHSTHVAPSGSLPREGLDQD